MKSIDWLLALLCALFFTGVVVSKAKAHDSHYHGWLQPNSTLSCCNERKDDNGEITADCSEEVAELRNGKWFVYLSYEFRWIEVPDNKLIRKHPKEMGKASICYNPISKEVLCFAQPQTGF